MIKNILLKEPNTKTNINTDIKTNAKYTIQTIKKKNNIINIISPK